jgi:hypothetical protein
MKTVADVVAGFRPRIDQIREEIDKGVSASRALVLGIDLGIELQQFDEDTAGLKDAAELIALRDEIKELSRRLAEDPWKRH